MENWKAIKTQEMFADLVIPHFRTGVAEEPSLAGATG
jgi:hypothetical protein